MKRRGRPPAGEGPAVDWDQVAEVLTHGELRPQLDGTVIRVKVSLRELAARHGVSPSLLCRFAKQRGIELRKERRPTNSQPKRRAQRAPGRPSAERAPAVNWDEVEQRLVLGDLRRFANGREAYVIPSIDDLADELGVDPSLVRRFARERKVREQRETATAHVPMRMPREDAERALTVLDYRARIPRIADIYAAQFEEDMAAGEVRRGEASTLERLSRLAMDVEKTKSDQPEDPLAQLARMLRERAAGIEERRRQMLEHPEMTGMIIDVPERVASTVENKLP